MRLQETDKGHVRVFLDTNEQEEVRQFYSEDPIKQLAIRLMIDGGLRKEETLRVSANDLQESENGEFTRLKVREGKTGRRSTVIPDPVSQQIRTVSNIQDTEKVIPYHKKTVYNIVQRIGEELAEEQNEPDWNHLSCHDLRRSWASTMVQNGISESLIMDWGGWDQYETFHDHYWMQSDDQIAQQLSQIQ